MPWQAPPEKRSYACNPELLVFFRKRNAWTQRELAKVVGYSERLILKAEAGQSVSIDTISHLAEALSLPGKTVHPEDLISDPVRRAKEYAAAVYSKGKGVVEAVRHFLDDDVIFRFLGNPKQIPFAGEHRGITAVQRAYDIFFSILEAPVNHDHESCYTFEGKGNIVYVW